MTSATPRYAPEVRLAFGGAPAPAIIRGALTELRVQTGLEGVDRVELALANEGLRFLDHPLFRLDTELQVSIGYAPDDVELVFNGVVVGTDATFPAESMPMLTVVAHDRRQRLQESSATRWFAIPIPEFAVLPIPDVLVAPAVALEHGLIPILDPIGAALSVLVQGASVAAAIGDPDGMQKIIRKQHDQTNLDFLELVARENGWEMLVDHAAEPSGYQLRFMSPLARLTACICTPAPSCSANSGGRALSRACWAVMDGFDLSRRTPVFWRGKKVRSDTVYLGSSSCLGTRSGCLAVRLHTRPRESNHARLRLDRGCHLNLFCFLWPVIFDRCDRRRNGQQ